MPKKKVVTTNDQVDTIRVEEVTSVSSAQYAPSAAISFSRRFGIQTLVVVLILALGIVSYLYVSEKKMHAQDEIPRATIDVTRGNMDTEMSAEVLQAVSELMILPEEQNPVIATVADAALLKNEQDFYQYAENGDILLVFPTSRQAVIYRPSVHKIVNVGPLIIDPYEL